MKYFFIGAFASLTLIITVPPGVKAYRVELSKLETAEWLEHAAEAQNHIARNTKRAGSAAESGVGVSPPLVPPRRWYSITTPPNLSMVTADGMILIRGGSRGQLLMLRPQMKNGKLDWQCLGGSAASMPPECRGSVPSR
jgi:hypothetical protein